jgi:putative CocE/NonD family hydrolase
VLNFSGWFDEAYGPEGAVTNFNGLRAARAGDDDPRVHLILGPWTHGVHATMSRRAGDIDFGPEAAIDYDDVILDFFDRYLRGRGGGSATPAVRYFVMGESRWREAMQWPPADTAVAAMYLGLTNDQEPRLAQRTASTGDEFSSFIADPEDPVVDPYETFGPHDYQQLAARQDTLTFDTEPLHDDLTVAGAITAVVHASCDCTDFDLWVRIQDVWPDGRAMNVMSPGNDVLRASYREPEAGRQLLEPGKFYELRLPKLITAIRFAKGHRLRVQLSASFAPHFSTNLQTGELETVSAASRPATITIRHDAEYPSRLLLPVLGPRP